MMNGLGLGRKILRKDTHICINKFHIRLLSDVDGATNLNHPPSSSEVNANANANASTIIQGPSLLTSTGVHRSSPSMFCLPGLRSLPFWTKGDQVAYNDPTVKKIVKHVESYSDVILEEYKSAVVGVNSKGKGEDTVLVPDYDFGGKGGEHSDSTLHKGQWDWHSYILKGERQMKFSKLCPNTTKCLEAIKSYLFSSTPFSFAFFSTLQPGASIDVSNFIVEDVLSMNANFLFRS